MLYPKDRRASTCTPLWTATKGGSSSPAVTHGYVFGTSGSTLYAFDAAGSTGCSGTPKTCTPLWSAAGGTSSPSVANGVVYVGGIGAVYAFDATGSSSCSGTPKVCTPLWSFSDGTAVLYSPTIANGLVYVGSRDHDLYAFKP